MPPTRKPATELAPTTLYRYGRRTKRTRRAHAADTAAWRRARAERAFPAAHRAALRRADGKLIDSCSYNSTRVDYTTC